MRWAFLHEDDRVALEWTEQQIKHALLEEFAKDKDLDKAFERVKQRLRREVARS